MFLFGQNIIRTPEKRRRVGLQSGEDNGKTSVLMVSLEKSWVRLQKCLGEPLHSCASRVEAPIRFVPHGFSHCVQVDEAAECWRRQWQESQVALVINGGNNCKKKPVGVWQLEEHTCGCYQDTFFWCQTSIPSFDLGHSDGPVRQNATFQIQHQFF